MPTLTTLDIFRDIALEFEAETDDKVNRFIAYAESEVSVDVFGSTDNLDYLKAVAYLTASKMKVVKASANVNIAGSSGNVIRKRVGNTEIQYGSSQSIQASSMIDNLYLVEFERLVDMYQKSNVFITDSSCL